MKRSTFTLAMNRNPSSRYGVNNANTNLNECKKQRSDITSNNHQVGSENLWRKANEIGRALAARVT